MKIVRLLLERFYSVALCFTAVERMVVLRSLGRIDVSRAFALLDRSAIHSRHKYGVCLPLCGAYCAASRSGDSREKS